MQYRAAQGAELVAELNEDTENLERIADSDMLGVNRLVVVAEPTTFSSILTRSKGAAMLVS